MDSLKSMQKLKTKKESSFTLLELLIVIAIIAILAAIVLIALDNAKQSANEARGLQFSQNIKSTLATDLVGEWSFDGGSGTQTNVIDDSGNGNNGTWNDVDPSPWYDKGKVRKAGQFFGDNYVNIVNYNKIPFLGNSSHTIESWVKFGNITGTPNVENPIIAFGNNSSQSLRLLFLRNSKISVAYYGNDYSANFIPKKDVWYHIVWTFSGNRDELYVNGSWVDGRDVSSVNTPAQPWTYHHIGQYASIYFNGFIDEVRVYKTNLTAQQIQQLYVEGLPRHLANYK